MWRTFDIHDTVMSAGHGISFQERQYSIAFVLYFSTCYGARLDFSMLDIKCTDPTLLVCSTVD